MRALIRPIAPRAFTLIEVLIGVLVLALGLLGLGAIIPVVIREQRLATEVTLANEVIHSAKKLLLGRPDLDPASGFDFTTNTPAVAQPTIGWDVWLLNQNWSPNTQTNPNAAYLWEPWRTTGAQQEMALTPASVPAWALNPGDFGWHITRPGTLPPLDATITLADRLWPNESMQGEAYLRPGLDPHRPQFVWDFIGRRVETKAGEPRQIQIAIFVRRIDQNIRIPRGNHAGSPAMPITLRDVLLNRGLPFASDARVPVCSYPLSSGSAQAYLPTNSGALANGTLSYSEPIFVDAVFDPADPERIEFPNLTRTDNAWKLISQSGQKLLDNLGNVYTVRGIADELDPGSPGALTEVLIDPPVPAYVPDPSTAPANSPGTLRQVVFTPQIPAAVDVFTITRTVP